MELRLRALEEEDLEQLRDWRNSDWLRPYVREYRLLNMVGQREWFNHIATSGVDMMFGIESDRRLIGVCGLTSTNWVNGTAEVSLYVRPKSRRKGFARAALELLKYKAFSELNLNRLWAEIYDFNGPSQKLFTAAGFVLEGRMVQHVFKMGDYYDSLIYGLVVDDDGTY